MNQIFANSMPYFSKYLSEKLLLGQILTEPELDTAYKFLLESSGLAEKTEHPEITINTCEEGACIYVTDLLLNKVDKIEGVNALVENQTIEFNPNLTIIYGANGSGKSGYIRLFKKAFFSRNDEEIWPNIYLDTGQKETSANFNFGSSGKNYDLEYPKDINRTEFLQFSVFDNKAASVHLNEKNEFEFRPIGLNYFSELIKAYKILESKLSEDIAEKSTPKDYNSLFDGESEIKELVNQLSGKTNIDDLKKFIPYTEEHQQEKTRLEEQKAELQALKKDREIETLKEIDKLTKELVENIDTINALFTQKLLSETKNTMDNFITKKTNAQNKGNESFKSELIKNVGSPEWKKFIEAAEEFSKKQEKENYPEGGDYCLLCHQPLSEESQKLLLRYWEYIKSLVEIELQKAKESLVTIKKKYEKINFNLVPANTILAKYLAQNYPETLKEINTELTTLKNLSETIISDIDKEEEIERRECLVDTSCLEYVLLEIEKEIKELRSKEPTKELEKVNEKIILLEHRKKLSEHIEKIEDYAKQLKWTDTAKRLKGKLSPRKITDKEKELSSKYFNQEYIDAFNNECEELNGNFGIEVKHTGRLGSSYRELKIKDRIPSEILSEGEQKVISLADFISEMRLSGLNRGLVFDDPVNSLDDERKSNIAERLVKEAIDRQVIVFTHDLVFVSCLIGYSNDFKANTSCHWIESIDGKPGTIWLNNTPSFEKLYKTSGKAQSYYDAALKGGPEERESKIKNGFASLRTSYEALVVFELFGGVVQRFNERVSIDSLPNVYFETSIRDEIVDSFYQCCRYMEGHSHSDKYAYKKPEIDDLKEEINRFNDVKKKLKELKKEHC